MTVKRAYRRRIMVTRSVPWRVKYRVCKFEGWRRKVIRTEDGRQRACRRRNLGLERIGALRWRGMQDILGIWRNGGWGGK